MESYCRIADHYVHHQYCPVYGFRTGLNLKMADPSLTAIQMCAAIILVMYGMCFAQEARGVLLLIYVILLLFGIFRLNTRSFLYISVFILLTYGGVIVHLHISSPRLQFSH